QSGRQVRHTHRGVSRVDALPAGPRGTLHVDAQLLGLVVATLTVLGFRQYGDRHRRRVSASGTLCHRHALHAMHAALELELAVGALPLDERDDLLEPAQSGGMRAEPLDAPALAFGVAAVHAEELCGEEARLLATGAGANFE